MLKIQPTTIPDFAAREADLIPPIDESEFERPLFQVFAELAARNADRPAVDDGATRVSYGALAAQARALGARIAAAVPPEGVVGVAVPNTVLYPLAWLACLAARRAFLPLDPAAPAAFTRGIADEAGLVATIVATAPVAGTRHLPALPIAPPIGPQPPLLPLDLPPAPIGLAVSTSGSTGRPRCIALHERSILRKAAYYRQAIGLGPDDHSLPLHAPATFSGSRETFAALLAGACLHVLDVRQAGLRHALDVLRHGGITLCATVPVMARALLTAGSAAEAFRRLRVFRLGGDTVLASDIASLAPLMPPTARILVGFGMGEAGGALFLRLIDPGEAPETGRISVGTSAPGQTVTIENVDGSPVQPGEEGVLAVRSRYVALGYLAGGRLDTSAFTADPDDPTVRRFRSGDVFLLREDGAYVPIGRADRQVKINGLRVEPGDTEAALRACTQIADAAVIVLDAATQPRLVACVVPVPGQDAATLPGALRATLLAQLPRHQVPAEIRVVPAIPLLPSLKPDLAALRAMCADL